MRILLAGATGVLGRATLPHLRGHEVVGLTRSAVKAQHLRERGVEAAVCDVFDYDGLLRLMQSVRPQTVVNFVTDLASGPTEANNRARSEGGHNLLNAATEVKAARVVVESVAFMLDDDAAEAVEQLEQTTRGFSGEALILRFGRLWGPGTFYDTPPQPPAVQIDKAGAEAARLLTHAPSGTYIVT
ncbi:MAG TPA: NAD-dependent epimerase/dehydratase family protein [Thermoleophilaceae bacterium]|nr:NAD-dependent epimerase/dehydratase family protein [Thermoleophilaceae bacterium]